ncbi:hypothetical protein LJR078_003233 [Arthrobacter sp. LjRoot78]
MERLLIGRILNSNWHPVFVNGTPRSYGQLDASDGSYLMEATSSPRST